MNILPPDPLSSEERDLATMLSRLGPDGEPSPLLDARILASARKAAPAPAIHALRPRWPVAFGLAASVVFAVGIAWQLRPTQPVTAYSDLASATEEAPPRQVPLPVVDAEHVPPTDTAQLRAPELAQDTVMESAAAAAAASVPEAQRVPRAFAPVESPPLVAEVAAPPAPPPPPPSPAPASRSAAATASPRVEQPMQQKAVAADALSRESARENAPARTGEVAGAGSAARRSLRVAPISERLPQNTTATAGAPARARQTELQVPVAADARLQVDDWLERVRTRYGLGDEDAARRSLLLFVHDHPSEPVPEDLEPLLDE